MIAPAAGAVGRRRLVVLACFALCLMLASPFFWAIYRIMVFNTLPRDDYAPFVMWLLGQHGGGLPESPYAYRILSAAAAVPFDLVLPALRFSRLPASMPTDYVRATAALAALAYTAAIGAGFVAARFGRRLGLPPAAAAGAGVLLFVLCWFAQIYGIDPLAILGVAVLVSVLRKRRWFVAGVLGSIVVNEKICMVLVLWLAIRWVLCPADRAALGVPLLGSLGALAAYLAMVLLVHVPGHSYQLRPAGYLATIASNLAVQGTARGVVLNLVPILVLAGVAVAGWPAGTVGPFRRVDILVIPALVLLALTVTHKFQIGRLVMHAAPLFVLPAAAAAGRWHARAARFIAGAPDRPI
jgi:hypothetical protein